VVGLGLIGGSLLRRLADQLPVCGYDADELTRAAARDAGYEVLESVGELVRTSQLVVLAVPLPELPAVIAEVAAAAHEHLVVTDVCSVKAPVLDLVRPTRIPYVGGHPMAGSERSGFAAADPALFDGAAWVLCLEDDTPLVTWLVLARLVTGMGCRVVPCTAADHDQAVARVSHLPHALAAALAAGAAGSPLALALAAGSFRDGTRVAATRPELSAAMCVGNAPALSIELDALIARLTELRRRLTDGEDPTDWFLPGHQVRTGWPRPAAGFDLTDGEDLRLRLLDVGRRGAAVTGIGKDGEGRLLLSCAG